MAARSRTIKLTALGLAVLGVATGVAWAAHRGSLDRSFGHGGSVTLGARTRLFGVTAQRDGKVVAVGESGAGSKTRLLLARFNPSGSLDRKFGHGGLARGPAVHTARATGSLGRAVAIQGDGKIVVVGKATNSDGSARAGILIERYRTNGSLDAGFGSHGVVNLLGKSFGDGYAVAITPGGKIIAAGSEDAAGSGGGVYPRSAIVRLNGHGRADGSFGHGGVDVIDLGPYSPALGVAAAPQGKIVIAGSQAPKLQATNALIARLTPSGRLDRSFNHTGVFTRQYARPGGSFSSFNAVALHGGKIVAAGSATAGGRTAFALAVRFNPSGRQDGAFGSGGAAYARSATNWTEAGNVVPGASGVAVTSSGRVIAAGQQVNSVLTDAALWGFTSSGRADGGFGSHGVATLGAGSEADGVVTTAGGALVMAGDTNPLGKPVRGLLARFR